MRIEEWNFKDLVLLKNRVEIESCYKKLETENNAGTLYETQGKLDGLKMGRDKIITEFGPMEGTMDREEEPPEINNLSKAALEHFTEDIERNRETWMKVATYAADAEDKAMHTLWNDLSSTVSRDMKRALGRKEGLRIFENLMDEITNTLVEVKENPSLFDVDPEEDNTVHFPQAEFDDLEDGEDPAMELVGESSEDMGIDPEEYEEEDQDYEEAELEAGTGE